MSLPGKAWWGLIVLAGMPWPGSVAADEPPESVGLRPQAPRQSLSLVGGIEAGEPHDLVVTCRGYQCSREHDLVYYDASQDANAWRHVRFVDADSLQPVGEGISLSGSSEGPLLYDTYHRQVYAFGERDACDDWGIDCYEQVRVHILAGRERQGFFTINDSFNSPDVVDNFYHIEGVTMLPRGAGPSTSRTILVVDNTPRGNLDIVHLQADGEDVQSVYRQSYRASLCSETQYHWTATHGNSLALDYHQGTLYLADNNSYPQHVRAFAFNGMTASEQSQIAVGQEALCWVFLQGLTVAQGRDVLYVPSGCQSFETGSTVLVDTADDQVLKRITYRYGDQDIVAVDSHDPRRVFITTSDYNGNYDGEQWLTLHMLYDDVVVASLPLIQGFGNQKNLLRDMVYDPVSSRLFLSVDESIVVVDVGGVPPAELWPEPVTATITPDHGGQVKAADGSATFFFSAGDVGQSVDVTYAEGPSSSQVQALAKAQTEAEALRTVRSFELTAVTSDTGTTVDGFDDQFTLRAETTAKERAGVAENTLALYWWDGSRWVKQPTTLDFGGVLYAYSRHTGRFASMGASWTVYLPLAQR